jgi:hypothetical protein
VRRCQTNRKHCLIGKQGNDLKKGLLELSSGGQGQSLLNPSRFAARVTILAMTESKGPSESSNAAHEASSAKTSASSATANQPETSDTSDETSASTFVATRPLRPRPDLSDTVSGVSSSTMSAPEVVRPHHTGFQFRV